MDPMPWRGLSDRPRQFSDREEAGRLLGRRLREAGAVTPRSDAPATDQPRPEDLLVLGLPRGGVVVARPVAEALGAVLDVVLVRKLGAPQQPELALGAIGEDGSRVLDQRLVADLGLRPDDVAVIEARERQRLDERGQRYRAGRPPASVEGRPVVLVDDGIATGSSMRVAIAVVRAGGAATVTVAVPVAPPTTLQALLDERLADRVVCLHAPANLAAVGTWYRNFSPVSDEEVMQLLADEQ